LDAIPGPHATRLTRSLLDLSSPKRGSTLDTRPSSAAAARSTKTDTFLRVHTMIHDKPHNKSKCGHGWCGRTRFPLKPENQGRHELHRNSTATNKHELGRCVYTSLQCSAIHFGEPGEIDCNSSIKEGDARYTNNKFGRVRGER